MSLETLAGVSLQQALDQAGNPARMLRSLPAMALSVNMACRVSIDTDGRCGC